MLARGVAGPAGAGGPGPATVASTLAHVAGVEQDGLPGDRHRLRRLHPPARDLATVEDLPASPTRCCRRGFAEHVVRVLGPNALTVIGAVRPGPPVRPRA